MRPPVVLGIETATEACGAAISDSRGVRAEALVSEGLSHCSRLIGLVERVMADTSVKLEELDLIAVSVGPGSFTGIRIGVSAAIGLASGSGRPVVGVPTLDALAWAQRPYEGMVVPFVDARRGEAYFSLYRAHGDLVERERGYAVRAPSVMMEEVGIAATAGRGSRKTLLAGPGSVLSRAGIDLAGLERIETAPPGRSHPSAAAVAALGLELHNRGGSGSPGSLSPIYVRRSDAELSGGRDRGRPERDR